MGNSVIGAPSTPWCWWQVPARRRRNWRVGAHTLRPIWLTFKADAEYGLEYGQELQNDEKRSNFNAILWTYRPPAPAR
jgi:hypothetical protein